MSDYDVVVVGAGNAGLTASTTLAQNGLKILLLERHNIPGGCATSFRRGRFEFEVALHQLSGLGAPEKPGPLRATLDKLGVLGDLEFVQMSDLYSLSMPDGFSLTFKTDLDQIAATLKEKFPHQRDEIKRFFDLMSGYAADMLGAFIFRDPEASREKYPRLYQYAFRPVKSVLEEFFTDPLLKAVLSVYWGYLGVPPDRLAFAYLAMLFFVYVEFKPYHLKGGSQALSNALLNKFLSHGGEVRFNCAAEKIVVRDGQVKAVVTEHGDTITTRRVLSNASQIMTYVRMIGPEHLPEEMRRVMGSRKISTSAFTLYVGFDREPDELGLTASTNFLLASTDLERNPYDGLNRLEIEDELLVLSCYDVADPDFSPPGACQANIVTLKYGDPWLRVPPAQYAEVKFRCAEGMLKRIEQIWPETRNHIEELEVGTPLTHMRYLGTPRGSVYGYEQQTKDSLFFQPGGGSPIQGLNFAGGWTGDCGFQPTLEAGVAAARSIIKQLG
ncbi:MAG: NAD(P)/FAD-dependent oxidoreductase [Thermodesulfobacteriota bacterium]